jgi:hypothetical protein
MAALSLVGGAAASPSQAPETPPLSPAREALADAIAAVTAAQQAFDEADRPVRALQAVITSAAEAEVELARLQAERQERLGVWLAGGSVGERPAQSKDEMKAEHDAKRARADAAAAELALPAILAPRQAALAELNRASTQRDAALCEAAVDAARQAIEDRLKPAILEMLRCELPIEALRHAVFAAGQRATAPISTAPGAAGRIVEIVRAAKREIGVERDNAAGERFLDRLLSDPAAKL